MRIRVDSIGCRLNIGEMDALARRFAVKGHRIVGPGEGADLVVFNTCAVTHIASRKSRKVIRQLRRTIPNAKLVVTGCYAELSPAATKSLGVDLVVPNTDKERLPELLTERGFIAPGEAVPGAALDHQGTLPGVRTRAFLKVQDGCNNRCTFCIITVARGDARSRSVAEIIEEVRDLVRLGYQEVVLTGVHLGSFGRDHGAAHGLEGLLRALLRDTDVPRVRLSSLEPWDLRPELFDLWSDPRVLPHLHLPLQSGCDATLARMARNTSQREFSAIVHAARDRIPDLGISTDVIVGFPGECDAEFEESLDFVRSTEFSRLHVFRYSPREGTAAATMPGRVDPQAVTERSERMHRLGAELDTRFRRGFVGRDLEVLWESSEPFGDGARWSGLSGNYLRVVTDVPAEADLRNTIQPATIVGAMPGALYGRSASSVETDLFAPGQRVAAY